ncbi:unnamed protein product, partial [Mesorhabditis spiculigera]
MGMLSTDELSFQRLVERTKRLARDDLKGNVWKVDAATKYLDRLYATMQKDRAIDRDLLQQYGLEVYQLRKLVEAEQQHRTEDKIRILDSLPDFEPKIAPVTETTSKAAEAPLFESSGGIRARNKAVYRKDLRQELLSSSKNAHEHDLTMTEHEDMHEHLANELLDLTRSLKTSMKLAGNVIREDNKRLDQMNHQVGSNKEKLAAESARLEKHAYKWCAFDCMIIVIFIFLFASFICMVIIMKIFPKVAVR